MHVNAWNKRLRVKQVLFSDVHFSLSWRSDFAAGVEEKSWMPLVQGPSGRGLGAIKVGEFVACGPSTG